MADLRFRTEELQSRGVYQTYGTSFGYPFTQVERLNTPISPKENFQRFISGGEYYWVPNLSTDFNLLFSDTTPDCMAQEFAGGYDAFGCHWIPVENAALPAFVKPGNPVLKDIAQWESFPWPDPDKWDWKAMREKHQPCMYPERANYGYLCGVFFERLIHLLDSEEALCALVTEEEAVWNVFDRLAAYHCRTLEHWKQDMDVDAVWIGDDWGTQIGPFFSRDVLNRLIAPHYRRILDKCQELEVFPITHSCGKTAAYMPDYIRMGIRAWQPQLSCNEDVFDLQKQYGGPMLHTYELIGDMTGTMSVEELRADTQEKARKYLCDGMVFVDYAAWDDQWREKNRVVYELLRKAASGELKTGGTI